VLAAVTAALALLRRFNMAALIACIISSVLALVLLVGVVGFIVAYFLYKSKEEFKDYKVTT